MRRLGAALVGAIVVAWSGVAAAQIDSAALADYCTSRGAFGEQFGAASTNATVRSRIVFLNAQYIDLSGFGPFGSAEITFTDDTRRIHTITGLATFESHATDAENEAEARAAYAAAVSALNQDRRFISQPSGDENASAYFVEDSNSAEGFRAQLTLTGRTVMFACSDAALNRRARTEWTQNFGIAPAPTVAPALVQDWDAAAIAEQQCTADGAFGQQFRQRVRGRTRQGITEFNRVLSSPAPFPPFAHVEVTTTPRSRLILTIAARATFPNARAAADAYNALVAAYEANGRLPVRSDDTLTSGQAGKVFSSDDTSDTDYYAFVGLEGRELILSCSDNGLMSQAFREAFDQR